MKKIYLVILVVLASCNKPSKIQQTKESNSKIEFKKPKAISTDSIYSLASFYLEKNNYRYSKKWARQLYNRDTSSLKTKELLTNIQNSLKREIKKLNKQASNISKFKRNHDEFNKITWISSKNISVLGNHVSLYFGKRDNGELTFIRVKIQYEGDDWIFWKTVTFLVDDNTYNFKPDKVERDNSSGTVWENSDDVVKGEMISVLNKIISSKKAKYRLSGKYYVDKSISLNQKTAMKNVLDLYNTYKRIKTLEEELD